MTDLDQLERDLLGQVEALPDEAVPRSRARLGARQEGLRVRAPEDLGAMTPEERKRARPLINGLRDKVQAAIATKKEALAEAALEQRLSAERIDVTLPVQEGPRPAGASTRSAR